MANATSIPLTTGENVAAGAMALGSGTSGQVLELNATTRKFQGLTKATLATQIAASVNASLMALTAVPDAAKNWDTTEENLAITHAAAQCDITLPTTAQITNWVPGSPPRRIFKMNTSANGYGLVALAGTTINGGASGASMNVPDSATAPSTTALGQWVFVYRQTDAAFWVWGGA